MYTIQQAQTKKLKSVSKNISLPSQKTNDFTKSKQ